MAKKELDRHAGPERVNFTFPIDVDLLHTLQKLGKKTDRTRASLLREAVREFVEKRWKP